MSDNLDSFAVDTQVVRNAIVSTVAFVALSGMMWQGIYTKQAWQMRKLNTGGSRKKCLHGLSLSLLRIPYPCSQIWRMKITWDSEEWDASPGHVMSVIKVPPHRRTPVLLGPFPLGTGLLWTKLLLGLAPLPEEELLWSTSFLLGPVPWEPVYRECRFSWGRFRQEQLVCHELCWVCLR